MKHQTMLTVQYKDDSDDLLLDVKFDGDTTWLSESEIALLFDTSRSNVGMHIKAIYHDDELEKSTTLKKFLKVGDNSKRYYVNHYNLDMIIAVGYKVKSKTATRFRRWATNIIREHITAGNYTVLAQEEALRLLTRVQVDDGTAKLISVATTKHRVRNEASFLEAGDLGMYNATRVEVEDNRKIPTGKLYDYIGSTELGMHVFRLTQTAEALNHSAKQGYMHNQDEAEEVHSDISKRTRGMAHLVHGQYPEDLPKAKNLDVIRAKNRALLRPKKPKKISQNQIDIFTD
jgi:prophage antirepressor-like protein